MKTCPTRVRQLREQRAWSQEQLAEIAGINVRTLQRVESAGGGSLDTRMALAAALEVTPDALCETPAPPPAPEPQASSASPSLPAPPDVSKHFDHIKVLLASLIFSVLFSVILLFGYLFGRDMAHRDNARDAKPPAAPAQSTPQGT